MPSGHIVDIADTKRLASALEHDNHDEKKNCNI